MLLTMVFSLDWEHQNAKIQIHLWRQLLLPTLFMKFPLRRFWFVFKMEVTSSGNLCYSKSHRKKCNLIQVCALAGSLGILEHLKFELKRLISKSFSQVICLCLTINSSFSPHSINDTLKGCMKQIPVAGSSAPRSYKGYLSLWTTDVYSIYYLILTYCKCAQSVSVISQQCFN